MVTFNPTSIATKRTKLLQNLILLLQKLLQKNDISITNYTIRDGSTFSEVTLYSQSDALCFEIFHSAKKFWFNDTQNQIAVSASHTDNATLLKINKIILEYLRAASQKKSFHRFIRRYFRYETYTAKLLLASKLDQRQWSKVNYAAFTLLNILKNEPRLGQVTRIIDGQHQVWNSMIQGELYPWLGISGTLYDRSFVVEQWKQYAQDYLSHQMPLSLYIHIPFCAKQCHFCHCAMTVYQNKIQVENYLKALFQEIDDFSSAVSNVPLITLFIGGGTPSMLSAEQLAKLSQKIKQSFLLDEKLQFTFEANPDSLTLEKLEAICQNIQINRLALGLQTLDPQAQKMVNRFNKPEKLSKLVEDAKRCGINVINLDLIAGLDGLSYQAFKKDLTFVRRLNPEIIKIYVFKPFQFENNDVASVKVDYQQIALRQKQIRWANKYLRRSGHGGFFETADKRSEEKNRQTTLYENNSAALMSLGVSGVSYIPRILFYESPLQSSQYFSKGEKETQYKCFLSNSEEEFHSYMVKNVQNRISVDFIKNHFSTFDIEKVFDVSLFHKIDYIIKNNHFILEPYSLTNVNLVKALCISPRLQNHFDQLWQKKYIPTTDYVFSLRKIFDGDV